MARLTKQEITSALERLGDLAASQGIQVELLLLGGAVMAWRYDLRQSTQDVDVVILAPEDRKVTRAFAALIAEERGWPKDWLNEGAKGFVHGNSPRETFTIGGVRVHIPALEQLLAMKLAAWRDELDIADAASLLRMMTGTKDEVWDKVQKYIVPGNELKCQLAFDDLWEADT